jgi:threonine/homoserine/homoserine lactone efflux protein
MALVFIVVGMPCIILWAAFGTSMRTLLTNPRWLRVFNWTMAALLVLSLYPIIERAFK